MDIRERITQANQQAVACIIDSDPYWVDIRPAGECVEGLEDHAAQARHGECHAV